MNAAHNPLLWGKHKNMLSQPGYEWGKWLLGAGDNLEFNVSNQNINYNLDPTQSNDPADGEIIKLSNCKKIIENRIGVEIKCNSTRVINKPEKDEAIADTGTTDQFLREVAPADEVEKAVNPIEIEMPNGTNKKSTHVCYLRKPDPKKFEEGTYSPRS